MLKRLIIVTNRLPFHIDEENQLRQAPDDLTEAVASYLEKQTGDHQEIIMTGMPGCSSGTWRSVAKDLSVQALSFLPVFVSPKEMEKHERFSNLLLQNLQGQTISPDADDQAHYEKVNANFAEVLSRNVRPGDVLLIYGISLAPLAGMLRKLMPELTIATVMDTRFPAYEIFRGMDHHDSILHGMLGSDLLAMPSDESAGHLLKCLLLAMGLDNEHGFVNYEDRLVRTAALPAEESKAWPAIATVLNALRDAREMQKNFQVRFLDEFTRRNMYDCYRRSKKRLILLDYDGTLVSFSPKPEMAVPGNNLLELIERLSASASNDVFLVSGRNSDFLEEHFGSLPVNLIAEHGASFKWKNKNWEKENSSGDWKQEAHQLMQAYVDNCPGSFIEEKEFSMAWHYRNAPAELAKSGAFRLTSELKNYSKGKKLQVTMGKKIVELRQSNVNKGSVVRKVIAGGDYDYIFAAGDDRTDEDMFKALLNKQNTFTFKVGSEASYATYNLHTPQMVISLLEGFDHLSVRT
jgi:trehalose 6-phosphate synthase/phosphatase